MASPKDWLLFAENDLKTAKIALKDSIAGNACFLSHQVAEKSLKAIILYRKFRIPKTHDLLFLLKLSGLSQNKEAYEFLNDFYIPTRYPDITENPVESLPSVEIAKEAVKYAEEIFDFTKDILTKNNDQKGFTPVLVLLVLALFAVTVGAYYLGAYYYLPW